MVFEHSFSEASWAPPLAIACGLLGLALLALVLRRATPSWARALGGLGIAALCTLGLLALRDSATKVAGLRLETEPPRLLLLRSWPGRSLELGGGELAALGIVSLGEDLPKGRAGSRQLLFGPSGRREVRSFLENDAEAAERLAERIAETFGVELQRFSGPPTRSGPPAPE